MEQGNSVKNFSFVGIARVVTIILQALFYLLFAALLDPEIYGQLSVILALASTFSTISLFGLNLSLQVYRAKQNSKVSEQILSLALLSSSIAAIILIAIDVVSAVLCIALSLFILTQGQLLGLRQYKKYMVYSVLKSSTFFIIPIILFYSFELPGIIAGMAISNFLAAVPLYRNIKIKSFFELKNHYKVLIHNFGVSAGAALPTMVDKLLIAPLFGLFFVGIYTFNLQIYVALSVLPAILSTYLISEESSGVGHRKLSLLTVIGSIVLSVISIVLAPFLVPEFFPKYSEGIESLQILVIAIIPQSIGSIYGSRLLSKESTKIGFTAIIRVGTLLILLAILGEFYGLVGLAMAVVISLSANTLSLYILYRTSISQKTIH